MVLARETRLSRAFGLGLTAGIVYFAGTLYWLTHVMVVYGGLPFWLAAPVNAAFVAYLALFPALFAAIVCRLALAHGPAGLLAAPLVWISTELGRTYLFTGFPWSLLGYSQATTLPIAQFASLFGVYGVSALVVSANAAAASVVLRATAGTNRSVIRSVSIPSAAIVAGLLGRRRLGAGCAHRPLNGPNPGTRPRRRRSGQASIRWQSSIRGRRWASSMSMCR